jgi:phosphoserine aminotransferase
VIHNFNSGPSVLPKEVFEQASQAVINFNDTGLSILEIGHRTPLFQAVLDEAVSTLKELMNLDADHEVLFMHGGASTQFFQVPMNLLNENETAAYLDCGTWGIKSIKEAKLFGQVNVVASSKDRNYSYIRKITASLKTQNIFTIPATIPSKEPRCIPYPSQGFPWCAT